MRRSFRSKEASPNAYESAYSSYSNGGNRSSMNNRSSQMTNSSECSSLASHPVNEEDEEEFLRRRLNRDSNGSESGNFSLDHEDVRADNLPLPPPPESNLTQSLSTLSLISLPPPPPEFSCNTLDTNTLSSVSSSSPSSSPSTATHSLERSCCNGTDPSRDNTLTRTNVRLHQEKQSNPTGYSRNHSQNQGAAGNNCCHPSRHRSTSLSPSSASSSSYDEDISCDGRGCSECPPIKQYHKQQLHKIGPSNRYRFPENDGSKVNVQTPCCSKGVIGAVGGRALPVSRSVSCCNREMGVKQKFIRAGSRDDSSASHIQPCHLNRRPSELINARRYKPMYSSSSSCSSRDGEDQSCSLRECQSPEDAMLQRLESLENVNSSQVSSHPHHKSQAQVRMKAKITGLNRSDQPIYDSVFTFRKQSHDPNAVINEITSER